MYLIDTNIWLERLLDQVRSEEVSHFLGHTPSDRLFITDFAFHSIAVVLTRLNQIEALLRFVQDAFIDGAVGLIYLGSGQMLRETLYSRIEDASRSEVCSIPKIGAPAALPSVPLRLRGDR